MGAIDMWTGWDVAPRSERGICRQTTATTPGPQGSTETSSIRPGQRRFHAPEAGLTGNLPRGYRVEEQSPVLKCSAGRRGYGALPV